MEPEVREPRWPEPNNQTSGDGERSPGGSVKRARERAAAGRAPDIPPMPTTSQSPHSPSSPIIDPSSLSASQRQPPQRPPRPSDASPMFPALGQYEWEDGRDSMSGYSTSSSRASTVATGSSTASIPDFPAIPNVPPMPLPAYQLPPRRNLGPPPSARRGASSYYSQSASFIPPIAEEASDKRSSYASSHVMPESWGDGPPDYLAAVGIEEEEEEDTDTERLASADSSGRQSKASDYSESSNLVKPPRTKPLLPFMETIESGDESASLSSRGTKGKRELDWQARQDERFRPGFGARDGIGRHNFKGQGNLHHPYSGYASDATFLDSPRSPSPSFMSKNNYGTTSSRASPARSSPIDPRIGAIMNNLERGGALSSSKTTTPGTSAPPSIHEKHTRRPPPLNLESSNGSRSHGRSSSSSLPDLIRRATRLASNLDRGKTTSRAGVLDMLARKDMEKNVEVDKASHDGSISDMLAAFPSPSPSPSPGFTKPKDWGINSPHRKSNLSRSQTVTYGSTSRQDYHRGRRCCGMPVWAFILLCIILLLLIAAAVVIPVTLIVVPRQQKTTANVENCKRDFPCGDRGTTAVLNNQCRCVCAQGYTGYKCETIPGTDCTTADFPAQNSSTAYPASTLGTDIPRVIQGAASNFSIPVVGWKVAAHFSFSNVSCADENALVTLGGNSRKLRRRFLFELVDRVLEDGNEQQPLLASPTVEPSKTKTLAARAEAQSSNGIVFAGGSSPGGSNTGGMNPSSTPSMLPGGIDDSSDKNPSGSDTSPVTPLILDFARVAILFVLQETGNLDTAKTMMTLLNSALDDKNGFDATKPVTVGGGTSTSPGAVSVDLKAMTVGWGNGTLYGGNAQVGSHRRWLKSQDG